MERIKVPYRLGTDRFCTYENEHEGEEEQPVYMGDIVSTVVSVGPDGSEIESVGELAGVTYSQDGFIDEVLIYDESGSAHRMPMLCDGVFYRG